MIIRPYEFPVNLRAATRAAHYAHYGRPGQCPIGSGPG